MKVKDLGDRVEITETVAEINQRYKDAGMQPPIIVMRPVAGLGIRTWLTYDEAKEKGINSDNT